MRLSKCEFILKALTFSLFLNCSSAFAPAQIFNLRLVTDASPDYSDLPSLIHSVTAKWPEPEQKCWAMFYWNHIARRQTGPMIVHGTELTDPIRQFNDYGYTMCSTISGINCALWHNMGLPVKFWDITLHTVPEVFYDQHWHMYDNSMSAIYTLCDGKTIASVQEIGREGACVLSKGVREPAHIAKYHCLYSTGPNGFLTGADTQRSVDEEARCFNPNGLKYRDYYFNWDYGHRYILNLKADETYTRFYKSLGKSSPYYVSHNGKDPDERYGLRGNGRWFYQPQLTNSAFLKDVYSYRNVRPGKEGLETIRDDEPAEVIIKTDGANVIASQIIEASFSAAMEQAKPSIALSKNNGKTWDTLWKASAENGLNARVLVDQEINGAYSALIKFELAAGAHIGKVILRELSIQTTTMLNAKTQPKLNLGRNTIYVSGGDQTDSLVVWPDLEGNKYKADISEEHNISSTPNNPGYQGTIYPTKSAEDAYLVYRLEAPRNIRRVNFGGRFYNRAPGSHIDLMYSVDQGK
jgi:hypothetical protein